MDAPTAKTLNEIEAAVSEGMGRFLLEFMGRGPVRILIHVVCDLVVVRLQGALTAAEQQLVKTAPPERGRDLVKTVRTQLIETARPQMQAMIEAITGTAIVALHHDIDINTGEQILVFSLASPLTTQEVASE